MVVGNVQGLHWHCLNSAVLYHDSLRVPIVIVNCHRHHCHHHDHPGVWGLLLHGYAHVSTCACTQRLFLRVHPGKGMIRSFALIYRVFFLQAPLKKF